MKKLILVLLIPILSFSQARQSLGLSVGESIYKDKLGTSRSSTLILTEYRYMLNDHIGIQWIGQMDVIRSWQDYDEGGYRAYGMSSRIELYKPILRTDRFNFSLTGGYGGMYTFFNSDDRERIQFVSGGVTGLYPLRDRNVLWGAVKVSYNHFYNWGQDTSLNGLCEVSNSRFRNLTIGFVFYLDSFKGWSNDFR